MNKNSMAFKRSERNLHIGNSAHEGSRRTKNSELGYQSLINTY